MLLSPGNRAQKLKQKKQIHMESSFFNPVHFWEAVCRLGQDEGRLGEEADSDRIQESGQSFRP